MQISVLIAIAAFAFFGLKHWGIASDCRPNQVDGQCGMSTAFGELFGIIAAVVIFVGGMIGLSIMWAKSKK